MISSCCNKEIIARDVYANIQSDHSNCSEHTHCSVRPRDEWDEKILIPERRRHNNIPQSKTT